MDWLAEGFETHRPHLRAVAYRMLGSHAEADDAVQDAWLRLNRSDADRVENLGGWLTTVVGRICLDMLRSRAARREEPLDGPIETVTADPEQQAEQADAVGLALLVVLDTLTPAERLAFVLHDVFAVPFDEIAAILDRSPAAARMLASRARRRVQTADARPDPTRQDALVRAFLAASGDGDFDALLVLLDPEVVMRADDTATRAGAPVELRGAAAVAGQFSGRAQGAQPVLVHGVAGAVWAPRGKPRAVFDFTVTDGKITAIDMIADSEHLRDLDLEFLPE
jgi:RNA polymerase sigma factor (sigma-70 family)